MKKLLYCFAALSVIAAMSCTREILLDINPWEESDYEEELVDVTVRVPGASTRAVNVTGESDVSSLQVFVFRSGLLESMAYSSNSGEVVVQCYSGTKDFVAIANNSMISDITTFSALREVVSELTDNELGNFVMYGKVEDFELTESVSIEIPVTRLVARIGIAKITNNTGGFPFEGDVVIKRIFAINVVGDKPFDSADSVYIPEIWLNQGRDYGDCDTFLSSGEMNVTLGVGKSYTTANYFYCYPNPTSVDSSLILWSPRYTRVAVEAVLGGETVYYSATFEKVKSNYTYTVTELVIQSLGAPNPDEGPREEYDANIVVSEWNEGYSGIVEF